MDTLGIVMYAAANIPVSHKREREREREREGEGGEREREEGEGGRSDGRRLFSIGKTDVYFWYCHVCFS